ncbi:hypothetical protein [Candidatus Phyllobacterium onerii]|uniref:hypothetical protein n=1 Tax=Candidatus Phyllobacterium onerii TaxID=3020828 RepID=UPI002330E1D3|nr:hypothetical protein [Phyllobacterium sp. IY22]
MDLRKAGLKLPIGVIVSKSIALSSSTGPLVENDPAGKIQSGAMIWLMARDTRAVSGNCDVR